MDHILRRNQIGLPQLGPVAPPTVKGALSLYSETQVSVGWERFVFGSEQGEWGVALDLS